MRVYSSLVLLCILFVGGASLSSAEDARVDDKLADGVVIAVEKRPGDNMCIEDTLSPYRAIVSLSSPVHNMWSGRFNNLRTDKPTTIGWNMDGQNGGMNAGSVTKWDNLKPVVCEGDDTTWDAYQFWTKNPNGIWECPSDPFRKGQYRFAGDGKAPNQLTIPTEFSNAYLDPTGKYFQCWREADSEVIPTLNTYRAICHFNAETATLAMRVPFRYSYLQSFVDKLGNANMSGVFVDTIGTTAQGRKLQLIRLEDMASTVKTEERKTVLILSTEHASEVSSAWCNYGALMALLRDVPTSKLLRKDTTWLFVLLFDPDGTENVTFDNFTDGFGRGNNAPPEVYAYARYFSDYIAQQRTIDIAVTLHNVEANECSNIFPPFISSRYRDTVISINRALFSQLADHGYCVSTPDKPWDTGKLDFRLTGWCAAHFGSLDLAYEVNDRYPQRRLSLKELQEMGGCLADQLSAWLCSDAGKEHHLTAASILRKHMRERRSYFSRMQRTPAQCTNAEALSLGY